MPEHLVPLPPPILLLLLLLLLLLPEAALRSTRGLGPTMTAQIHSIGISIGMLQQTLIMSRLDQLSRLGERIYFFH